MDKDLILAIKNELSLISVMNGIHFSDLVGNTLDIGFRTDFELGFKDRMIQHLKQSLFIHRLKVKNQPEIIEGLKSNPWYILSSAQTHFVEFMLPLKTVSPELVTVMQKENKLAQLSVNTYAKSAINEFKVWKKQNWDRLKTTVTNRLKSFNLDANQLTFIFDHAEIGMIRIFNAKYWLTQYNPEYVLTEYDREFGTSPIISAANHLNISTGTMVHGSTYPIHNYWPPIAHKVFTWGSKQSDHFANAGLARTKLFESGSTRAKYNLEITKDQVCDRLKLPFDLIYIVFISNNIELKQRHHLIQCFASESYKALNMQLVLKLHPREQKSDYDSLPLEIKKNLLVLDATELSSDEAMSLGAVFVGHNSVMLLECLLMEKPVVIMDVIESNPGIGIELHDEGKMPIIRTSQEWVNLAEQLSEEEYRLQLIQNSKSYSQKQCANRDVKAAALILNEISKKN